MATDAEVYMRIETVAEMIIKGLSRSEILRNCANMYNVKSRIVDEYINRAKKAIKENANKNIEENTDIAIARYNYLFQKSLSIQDYGEARQVQNSICKLLGLEEAAKIDITSKGEKIQITPIEFYDTQDTDK